MLRTGFVGLRDKAANPTYALMIAPVSVAGGGCFLGFFASLVLRCCPLAMIILLVVMNCEICATDALRLRQGAARANDNPRRENVKLFLASLRERALHIKPASQNDLKPAHRLRYKSAWRIVSIRDY